MFWRFLLLPWRLISLRWRLMSFRWHLTLLPLAILMTCTSCALVEVDKRTSYEDINGDPSVSLLRKVRKKVTTRDWLVAQFDEPMHAHVLMDNKEILTWRFSTTQHHTTSVLVLFKFRSAKSEQNFLHVVLQDNIVKKRWLDKYEHVDTGEYGRKLSSLVPRPVPPKTGIYEQHEEKKKHDMQDTPVHIINYKYERHKPADSNDELSPVATEAKSRTTLLSPKVTHQN